jgi:acyl carrier protein
MAILDDLKTLLDEHLALGGRGRGFTAETTLFGTLPELDSFAVVGLVGALEARFHITIDDAEITFETFETVGALARLVERKRGG